MITSPVADDLAYIHENFVERERLAGSTVIITGAGGFLGYYLVRYLADYRNELGLRRIVAIDPAAKGEHWLAVLAENVPELDLVTASITDVDLAQVAPSDGPVHVIHAASIASPTFYRQFPVETIDSNIWGLRRILDQARDLELRGLLFFSSSEIYGDPPEDQIPTHEEYRGNVSCTGPRACYDESKRFGETIAWVYAQQYGTPITIARPFNNYGPGMSLSDKRLPADLASKVLAGEDIEILSSGAPTRTFCYVADAVLGYLKCLVHGTYDYFNIGNAGPELSVVGLAEEFRSAAAELWDYQGDVLFAQSSDPEYLTHNPQRRQPDVSKAEAILGYRAQIDVHEGVRRYLRHVYCTDGPGAA